MLGAPRRRSAVGIAISLLFRAIAIACMLATPVLGVWVASSLAAYDDGPVWVVVLSGLLLFPILPVT